VFSVKLYEYSNVRYNPDLMWGAFKFADKDPDASCERTSGKKYKLYAG
jgi:hypothetical protein